MQDQEFENLVSRLEITARINPNQYILAVIGLALLGFCILGLAIGFALLTLAALVAMVFLVIATGGKALIIFAKLGKLVFLLAIPAWTMVKTSFTLIFSRFPRPQGRVLTAAEAPALFAQMKKMGQQMRGPRIHQVLLVDDLNAAIVQHPRFGLFGWEENFLILGLPLLLTLSEDEALAVVAHEYGHLSGHHSRLGGFIYRFRIAWGRLQAISEEWNDWGSRLIARLFRWYAPYFNAYTFVLARQNEYVADRTSAELAGKQNAANALMHVNIAAQFENEEFWPSVNRRVAIEPEPLNGRSALWVQSLHSELDEEKRSRFLETANQRKTDHMDTHPALCDRLAAMGQSADNEAARQLTPPGTSAAEAWFGPAMETIKNEFDLAWKNSVAEQWHSRHTYLQQSHERLTCLESQASLNVDERWEFISLLDELKPGSDLMPHLNALLEQAPHHLSARFRHGILLLANGDETGIREIEHVMKADADAILTGCEEAWRFYHQSNPEKAEYYRIRWQDRAEHLEHIQQELRTLPPDASLAANDLDTDTLDTIRQVLRDHGKHIRRVYILRRILKSDRTKHDYVLAFETSHFTFGLKGNSVAKRLSQQEFPMPLFIIHLGAEPYKRFRKSIERLQISPLDFS